MPLRPADRSSDLAIDVRAVARRFGAHWGLRGATLQVSRGEVIGVLGANGSGKSTLLRTLATLLRPTAGSASVQGFDVVTQADDVRRHIGFLAHAPGLYEDLSAGENLRFSLAMRGQARADGPAIDEVLSRVGLAHVGRARVRGFSAGMQRRLALARLLLAAPAVLLLDEPYSNLDADGISLMNAVIAAAAARGGAALVVLHELAPAAGLLDRTVTIERGKIASTGDGSSASRSVPGVVT